MATRKPGMLNNPKSKKKMRKPAPMKKGGIKKKMMAGPRTQNVPAASFLEPPMEQPFAQTQQNPAEFTAKSGGVKKKRLGGRSQEMKDLRKKQREARKKARQERRADRRADRDAVRALKTTSKATRRDKINDAGEDISMTRAERRADRRATNKASRTFKRQERKARRTSRKDLRKGQKGARQEQRGKDKIARQKAIDDKLAILNQSESSSVKPKVNTTTTQTETTKDKTKDKTTTTKVDTKKKTKGRNVDDMSFSEVYRYQRESNKKDGIPHHGDDRGYFTWRGKEYSTESASEKKARLGSKDKKKEETKTKEENKNNKKKKEEVVCSEGVKGCKGIPTQQHAEHTKPVVDLKKNKNTPTKVCNKPKSKKDHANQGTTTFNPNYPEPWKPKYKRGGYKKRGGRR